MGRLAGGLGILLLLVQPAAAERVVTDSAGRQVAVPDRIERVFAAGPPASILLYILAPDRMIGWPRAPHPEEIPYIAPEYRDLPEVGWLTGRGDTVNLEVLLQSKPDLIFDFGSVRDTYVSLAERVQAQTGIPYILIDGTFANTAAAVRLLGEVLGVEDRAEQIASYVENTFARIDATLAQVPQEAQPRVYLARGPTGARRGLVQVPIEQVVVWNPDTVITWDPNFYESVWKDFYWQGVDAVAAGRVYLSPTAPFGWIDRPPSLNRIIGLKWLAGLFYPDHIKQDLREVTRSFYDLFYHVDLTGAELDRLLQWAKGRAP
jgi:iron complex transport system substrate-binding protein